MAFDALHQLRYSKPLPVATHRVLAALLDFGACTNAIFDEKAYCRKELEQTRQILDEAGLHSMVEEVLRRLSDVEGRRPSLFGDDRQFHEARSYREAVARLWLGTVAATAAGSRCLEEGILATYADDVLKLLFRIVMQCQIIDDVLDYSRDASAGLPSFLTASASLPDAIERTHHAACEYAHHRDLPGSDDVLPLRVALGVASFCAKLMIRTSQLKHRLMATAGLVIANQAPSRGFSRFEPNVSAGTAHYSCDEPWTIQRDERGAGACHPRAGRRCSGRG